ncbi:MAG: SDR family NAD(P)-dependent oxidoreductase [Alphaproteobacteria bacterium]|nr:SDR family NAD(P)-dependent oxidoreductase [Alphaproteobacteria bacterium]MBU6472322.1 SDR family NAD(P)-dependent oxidoreductase [Alphaproteobacteria bacterium]MDE2012533.1 SDR family NAD(P)-dependent oxidoreductase [Alphaproteobacteria bacterium]MDE2072914.1 SDR family NAD(P)-dependent oxidoreductase [Alphaproteobacteria bacterium]MDE2351678.1 SDR family NAD(P)-dependent oxidoreductase [Alphaproteobacteria bacterium]
MPVKTLRDKIVVITGAASGIGRAAALAFAKRGAHIVAADLNAGALEPLGRGVTALGVRFRPFTVDVADEKAMKEFSAAVTADGAVPDVLINNAGIGYMGAFLDSDLAHWRRVLAVNVMGVVHGCYFFVPGMIAAGGPRHVLNVASAAGNFPVPSLAAYSTSKAGVKSFSEVLRMELRDTEVSVTTVCPGIIDTPIVSFSGTNAAPTVSAERVAKLQAYYKTKGCSPDVVAEDMVRASLDGRDMLLTGPSAKFGYYLTRLSPRLTRAATIRIAQESGYL